MSNSRRYGVHDIKIGRIEAINCSETALRAHGAENVSVEEIIAVNTPHAVIASDVKGLRVGKVDHRPNEAARTAKKPEQPPREESPREKPPRKYFSGFSFAKGDHLK